MSIKAKLSLSISFIVGIILLINLSFYYYSSKAELLSNAEEQMRSIVKQIGATLESSQQAKQFMEDSIADKLRQAAIAAKFRLDPDIANVTNEQLVQLSAELAIDHISLWVREDNDIVIRRSSDPNEMNISSKTWDYWYTAFNQLFDNHKVTIPEGLKLKDYWSGPINFSTSNPAHINKWGSYYDGTTNYMINPFINAAPFFNKMQKYEVLEKLLKDNENVLEITGFDPDFFGKPPIIKIKKGKPVYNLDVRDIIFGKYTYQDTTNDVANLKKTIQTNDMVTTTANIKGKQVIKSFMPLTVEGTKSTAISITIDRGAILQNLNKQLYQQILVSFGLMLFTIFACYFIVGYMIRSLQYVLNSVNAIAAGNFDAHIDSHHNDELGLLASRVNSMSDSLNSYMTRLTATAEELRSTKEYLESFINHTSDAIHVSDLQGNVTQINRAFEKMFGWSIEETTSCPLLHIPEYIQAEYNMLVTNMLQGETIADYETVRLTKDGRIIDVSITISPIRNENGAIVAIASISRNITARKHTEEVLRRSEKLSVVGQLAAGVAHEIRNPLTTLRGFVQLQKTKGPLSESILNVMLSELDRINFIVSEFLVLAKPQINYFQLVDVRDLLRDIILLLDSHANMMNIAIETNYTDPLPHVKGEPNQLKQVFINVLKNGMESMPEGGTMCIEVLYNADEHYVSIHFIDHGCGISEDQLKRLGEPFFTSKETGNGLGLMVSQQIIANHKGSIHTQSELDKGTCVEIRLPVVLREAMKS